MADELVTQARTLERASAGRTVALSFSVVIAISTLAPDATLDTLLSRTDTEKYQAKRQRKGPEQSGTVPC